MKICSHYMYARFVVTCTLIFVIRIFFSSEESGTFSMFSLSNITSLLLLSHWRLKPLILRFSPSFLCKLFHGTNYGFLENNVLCMIAIFNCMYVLCGNNHKPFSYTLKLVTHKYKKFENKIESLNLDI